MVGLPEGEKTLRICITVYAQYRRVTDRRTDGQTSCHGIVRAMHTRCVVKIMIFATIRDARRTISVTFGTEKLEWCGWLPDGKKL